jgi:Spy/CpxP family protein refolding chaperone
MKRAWVLILLVSLGLNLGLAWRFYHQGRADTGRSERFARGSQHGRMHSAHDDSAGWHRLHDRRIERITHSLGLTPAQVEGFRRAQRETGRLLRERSGLVRSTRLQLLALAATEPLDEDGVRRAMAELSRQQAKLDSLVAETMLEEMHNLDPEQRTLYLKMLPLEPGGAAGRGTGRRRGGVGQ